MDATYLSCRMREHFAGGIRKLARLARWEQDEIDGVCWLAAARALGRFDPRRGALEGRFWHELEALARAELAGHPLDSNSIDDGIFDLPAPEPEPLPAWRSVQLEPALEQLLDLLSEAGIHAVARRMRCSVRTAQRRLKNAVSKLQGGTPDFGWGGVE